MTNFQLAFFILREFQHSLRVTNDVTRTCILRTSLHAIIIVILLFLEEVYVTRKATLQLHFSCNFPLTLLLLFTLSPLNNNSQTLEDAQEPTKSERRDCVKIEPKVLRKKCKTPNIEKSLDVFCKRFTQISRKKLNGKSSFLQHLQSKRVTWIEISL